MGVDTAFGHFSIIVAFNAVIMPFFRIFTAPLAGEFFADV